METQQRSTEYNFQGIMYFFRREKIQCRYQFSLRDAVDITLLQRALTAALASAPYYTQRLVQEKREMWLEPNTEPCLVYPGSTMRNIPEQTNGYLFCVSCEGDTVYFDWHHFLLDGHGVSPLLTSILEQYCNLRYGTAFAVPQIVCDPPYDIEAMLAEVRKPLGPVWWSVFLASALLAATGCWIHPLAWTATRCSPRCW